MNKKNILWIILDLIFLAVFNVCFFVLEGTDHNLSVWISYGFIHFSYILLLVTPFLIRKSNSIASFGFSLYSISSVYFLSTFVVGLIFILAHLDNYKVSFVVHVILTGIYGIMLISHMIANESTADSVERHEEELRYVKDCSARLKGIMDGINDKKLRKKVKNIYDLIYSSPVKSNSSARYFELKVIDLIGKLEINIVNKDECIPTINEIEKYANERNRILKYGN